VKRLSLTSNLLVLSLLILVVPKLNARDKHSNDDSELSRIITGLKISPVGLNLKGKNLALVGLGSYIVNAQGACNDCHTNPAYAEGHDPFLGQPAKVNADNFLAGGVMFGPFISRNITPDPDGLPAGLTFLQFKKTLRTGVDPDQLHPQISPLLQVMPWPVYGKMKDHDLRAIYEYLRSIPHAEPGAPAPAAARQTQ
jgi:hypothetical protein